MRADALLDACIGPPPLGIFAITTDLSAPPFSGGVVVSFGHRISLHPRAASLLVWRMRDPGASLSGDVFAS